LTGALDDQGWPVAWVHRMASGSIAKNLNMVKDGIDRFAVEGASNLPYSIPNLEVTSALADLPITVWFWRSVGSSLNAFVTESFFDELCALGNKDPLAARLRLLDKAPRHKKVLEVAAEKSGWGKPLEKGRARGLAVAESFGSFVAEVAEVSISEGGTVRVHRVTCAIDCGDVVNPSTVKMQMESGIVYGLSAALYGQISIKDGHPATANFDEYPVLRMNEMPEIETHIVTSGEALGGVGEPGTPPIAPAVANAIFALTKKPIRRLPILGSGR
jgi:isoquinoline 1-oxidoreductase beta subunit